LPCRAWFRSFFPEQSFCSEGPFPPPPGVQEGAVERVSPAASLFLGEKPREEGPAVLLFFPPLSSSGNELLFPWKGESPQFVPPLPPSPFQVRSFFLSSSSPISFLGSCFFQIKMVPVPPPQQKSSLLAPFNIQLFFFSRTTSRVFGEAIFCSLFFSLQSPLVDPFCVKPRLSAPTLPPSPLPSRPHPFSPGSRSAGSSLFSASFFLPPATSLPRPTTFSNVGSPSVFP